MPRLVSVAVPVPLLPPLTYRVPEGTAPPPAGGRVRVPLGRRTVIGCVVPDAGDGVEAASAVPLDDEVRDVIESLDDEPYLPLDVVRLALWVADYYVCGAGDAIATALPPLAASSPAGRGAASGFRTERIVCITPAGLTVLEAPAAVARTRCGRPSGAVLPVGPRLGPRQRDGLNRLAAAGKEGLPARALAAAGVDSTVVARLRQRGLVSVDRRRIDRDPFAPGAGALPPEAADPRRRAAVRRLTDGQRAALDILRPLAARNGFDAALLRGVTGSGKTEVYLRLARDVVAAGRGVLVLVPEIALTPAVAAAFRDAFGPRVAIQHSGLSDGERHDQWHRIRGGAVDVVVGTRSAVFAPLDRLGLVVVDEEHDASYKQDGNPRYHARSVAIVRAQAARALVVLGSATPSLESAHHAARGKYHLVTMDERVHRRPLADVRIVDMRKEVAETGPDTVLSGPLREALGGTLDRGEQALILLNRRGFATALLCRSCGLTLECSNCSVSLTLHRAANRVRCHYCNYSARRPKTCAHCAGPYLETVGIGTERIEAEVAEQFPSARVARLDRDTTRRRGALASLLADFRDGSVQVLVGTQMIAKGHDFPERDAGGGRFGRCRPRSGRLPGRGTDLPVAHPGGGTRRAGRPSGSGDRAVVPSGALRRRARLPPGVRAVLRRGDALPRPSPLSAGRFDGKRRGAWTFARRRDEGRRRPRHADPARRGRQHPCSRSGGGAAGPPPRPAPRADLPEEQRAIRDAPGGPRRPRRPPGSASPRHDRCRPRESPVEPVLKPRAARR